jgi:hypothetical protein
MAKWHMGLTLGKTLVRFICAESDGKSKAIELHQNSNMSGIGLAMGQ